LQAYISLRLENEKKKQKTYTYLFIYHLRPLCDTDTYTVTESSGHTCTQTFRQTGALQGGPKY